ncbi:helix-turn-helix domain-containing protein [Treponema lecithinolyticum]
MYTTAEVVEKTKMSAQLVRKWAKNNGVPFVGEGRRKDYQWRCEDIKRFLSRDTKRGKRAKQK